MHNIIAEIKQKKGRCIFVSPHLDDAVFSAGALLYALKKEKIKTDVVTVFTKAHKENTLSAKAFLKQCHFNNGITLYKRRKEEDKQALNGLGTVHHLELTEALWRRKQSKNVLRNLLPEFGIVYPTYRWHIVKGHVSPQDAKTMLQIKKKLQLLIHGKKNVWVFCPIGVGNHVDHILVRDVCNSLDVPVVYWADYPYTKSHDVSVSFVRRNSLKEYTFRNYIKEKIETMNMYKTQLHVFQPLTNKKALEEKYYTHI